jgi:hypothetical protein
MQKKRRKKLCATAEKFLRNSREVSAQSSWSFCAIVSGFLRNGLGISAQWLSISFSTINHPF